MNNAFQWPWQVGSRLITMAEMKHYFANQFLSLWARIEVAECTGRVVGTNRPLSIDEKQSLVVSLQKIASHADSLGLVVTFALAKRMSNSTDAMIADKTLSNRVDELKSRLDDELGGLLFLFIPRGKLMFFTGERISSAISSKLPAASGEISEASRCFALDRYTACVFHLMRALEIGLRVLSKSLKIPDQTKDAERNWGKMLKAIKEEIELRNQRRSSNWRKKKHFYESTYALLEAVRNPWRNASMHVDINYDEEKALDIFNATDALLRHLATQLAE
ncbi:MAG: hypothetical protein ABSF76_01180 [Opitutaceae bacterium]|jgi:hypothetical protein